MPPEQVNQNDEQTNFLPLQEAERRRSLCLAGAGLGLWTYNPATDEFWADNFAKHLHGYESHEVHTFAEAGANIHPEDCDRTQAAIIEAIQACSKLQIEYRVVWRDGSIHWLASQAGFVPSSESGEGMFYGSVQDISDRKRKAESREQRAEGATQRIEGQAPRLESGANLLPSSSYLLPSTLRILLVDDNADMRAYLKRVLEKRWQVETATNGAIALTQIQQNPPDLVLADVMMPEINGLQLLQALRSNPQTQSIPVILLSDQAGAEATIEGLETGANDYLIKPFSSHELMARVKTHLQLALLRQERSANRFKTEFLLTVTHELQAPLALILGWVRLLQTRSFDADRTAQALATIERNATIEAKLVKDLLDVAGLLSGKVKLKSQVVELAPLLQNVITQFQAAAVAKQIQFVETVLNVPQRDLLADGDRLRQIIANLIENAIKFTPEGGRVTVQLECTDSEICIAVADTGIGISPDFLPYVFDRFTQAEVPSCHSPGGVGIGLAIARFLVELHQGTIEVASEGQGRGATFMVRLPLRMDNS